MSATKEILQDLENLISVHFWAEFLNPARKENNVMAVQLYAEQEFQTDHKLTNEALGELYESFQEYVDAYQPAEKDAYMKGLFVSGQAVYRYYEQICKRKGLI